MCIVRWWFMRILCVDCNLEEIPSVNNFIFTFSRPICLKNITYFCRDKSFVDKSSREVVLCLVFRWTIKITATLVCRVIEHDKSNPRMLSLLQKIKASWTRRDSQSRATKGLSAHETSEKFQFKRQAIMPHSETLHLRRNDPCKLCNASWRASCAVIALCDYSEWHESLITCTANFASCECFDLKAAN